MERWFLNLNEKREDHNFLKFAKYYLDIYLDLKKECMKPDQIPKNRMFFSELEKILVPHVPVPFSEYFVTIETDQGSVIKTEEFTEHASGTLTRLLNERIASKDALSADPDLFYIEPYTRSIRKQDEDNERSPKALLRAEKLISKLESLHDPEDLLFPWAPLVKKL